MRFAKAAPAPNATNPAGKAQQTRAEEDAKREKKLAGLSFILFSIP